MPSPKDTFTSDVFFSNAYVPIDPSPSGRLISIIAVFPLNAPFPIDFNDFGNLISVKLIETSATSFPNA